LASSTGIGGDTVRGDSDRPTSSSAPTSGPTCMRRSSPQRERASVSICPGFTVDVCRSSSKSFPKPTPTTTCSSYSMAPRAIAQKRSSVPRTLISCAFRPTLPSSIRWRGGFRSSEESYPTRLSRPSSYCKRRSPERLRPTGRTLPAKAHRFLLVDGSSRCVVTSITWLGISWRIGSRL
jgi:hypothetical protein